MTRYIAAYDTDQSFDQPIYQQRGGQMNYAKGQCPVADDLFLRNISIPLNQRYSEQDCDKIANGINKVLTAYCEKDDQALAWL